MRTLLLATATILALAGLGPAQAETTVIHRDGPDEVVDRSTSESKTVTTREDADGCSSKTVSKENDLGERKTVTRESCD